MDLKFIFICSRPDVARFVTKHGVDWVMIDLERVGKGERQGHLDTVQSAHTVKDVRAVRAVLPSGKLLVRTDPINPHSSHQIDSVIAAGADLLMLPFFRTLEEVQEFVRMVDGRAQIMLLAETKECLDLLPDCCALSAIKRVHIGLNDLSLDLGVPFMFELLVDGTVEKMASDLRSAQMPFGIGGVARVSEGLLPAELILAMHAQLGSDAAIMSRPFHSRAKSLTELASVMDFSHEVKELNLAFQAAHEMTHTQQLAVKERVAAAVSALGAQPSSAT